MPLPTNEELCPFPENLDGQWVLQHLLGKDVQALHALLVENDAYYDGLFLYMGVKALPYYLPAATMRINDDDSDGHFASGIAGFILFRLEYEGQELERIAGDEILSLCDAVVSRGKSGWSLDTIEGCNWLMALEKVSDIESRMRTSYYEVRDQYYYDFKWHDLTYDLKR